MRVHSKSYRDVDMKFIFISILSISTMLCDNDLTQNEILL
jgi:hypothetical protein